MHTAAAFFFCRNLSPLQFIQAFLGGSRERALRVSFQEPMIPLFRVGSQRFLPGRRLLLAGQDGLYVFLCFLYVAPLGIAVFVLQEGGQGVGAARLFLPPAA